jgi:pimeloyl-ACP methyl ester carboxylesterase
MSTGNIVVKRGYVDTPDGQIHFRAAGVDAPDRLPLICFHQSPSSSLTYQEILPYLGRHRRVVAMDTPGYGESFRPQSKPSIPDYARWLRAGIAALGYDAFDVAGMFTGAAIASEMAKEWPNDVKRVVLIGPPYFDAEHPNKDVWPELPKLDGSHMIIEWNKMMETLPFSGVTFERQWETFRELWRGGKDSVWGEEAVTAYPLKDTLPHMRQHTLVVHPDHIRANVPAAVKLLPNVEVARIHRRGYFMMQVHAEEVAAPISTFLNAAG